MDRAVAPPPAFLPVREVCRFALVIGCSIAIVVLTTPSALQGSSLYYLMVTPAEAAELGALERAMPPCGAAGAVAAAVALLLRRRARRALALAALAAAAASGGMLLRFCGLAMGPLLSHRAAVAAHAFFGTVFGLDILLCFAGIVWGEE